MKVCVCASRWVFPALVVIASTFLSPSLPSAEPGVAEWVLLEGPLWEKEEEPAETWKMKVTGLRGRERPFGGWGQQVSAADVTGAAQMGPGWPVRGLGLRASGACSVHRLEAAPSAWGGWLPPRVPHVVLLQLILPPPPTFLMSCVTQRLLRTSEQPFFSGARTAVGRCCNQNSSFYYLSFWDVKVFSLP